MARTSIHNLSVRRSHSGRTAGSLLFLLLLNLNAALAQTRPSDRDLVGFWVMESMQYEGENKVVCGNDFTQIKYYGPSGEYACAEVLKGKDGAITVRPHQYGTYTYKSGKYTECGHSAILVMVDKTTFKGRWNNRHDVWRKRTGVPAQLVNYIVKRCREKNDPVDIQRMARQHLFNRTTKKLPR